MFCKDPLTKKVQDSKPRMLDRDRFSKLGLEIYNLNAVAHAKRITLNTLEAFFRPPFPLEWDVPEWKLSTEHITPLRIIKDIFFYFVDTYKDLNLMKKQIEKENVVSGDCEFAHEYNFHTVTALTQRLTIL